MRIHQLPPAVVAKIAAGEVIERPASVLKELLENAVDAASTRIDVDVEQGGTELIRVVDNGGGIVPDDLPLAFASHATSKLASADDLFRIHTLGFRGEALASIGGVAQVTLQSRPPDRPHGAEIECHGGTLSAVRAWNGAPGTRVEVRHLFFNTPVRRKFLRTTATEMGHVEEAFTRLALARPDLHLTLTHNGKPVHSLPASVPLPDRLTHFFGKEVGGRLYAVDAKQGAVRLRGYVADPACERGSAKTQYLFVNGRWVRDRVLGHAIQEAYRGLLMTGRYAVVFLFLDLPPDQVDVNVHPTKAEIRFRESQAIYHLVFSAVRERLRAEDLTARLHVTGAISGPDTAPAPSAWTLRAPEAAGAALPFPQRPPLQESANHSAPVAAPPPLPAAPPPEDAGPWASPFKAIQLYDAYVVVETPEGMLVIDQHALHERILFEQLKKRINAGPLETQRLLIPEPVDLPAEQAACALEHREALAELGLHVEDFGGGTLLLTGYPAMIGHRSPQSILKAAVDYLLSKDRPPNRDQLLNDLLSIMACHAAVRAGDRLTPEEMAALVAQRDLAQNTHHCPHGRPTALLFSRHDLERQFRRI
jgi:DNA mismatch repair protein MutL